MDVSCTCLDNHKFSLKHLFYDTYIAIHDVQTKTMETKTERGLVDIMFVHISTQLSGAFHSCLIIYDCVLQECMPLKGVNKSVWLGTPTCRTTLSRRASHL